MEPNAGNKKPARLRASCQEYSMPITPFCAKAVCEQRFWRVFGLRPWPLPLRDSAGLSPVFPHCVRHIRVPAHQERHYCDALVMTLPPAPASVNARTAADRAPYGRRPVRSHGLCVST